MKITRFRFSLVTLFAAITVAAVLLGGWCDRARKQRHAVRRFTAQGAFVAYDCGHADDDAAGARTMPSWMARTIGVDYFHRVVYVSFEPPFHIGSKPHLRERVHLEHVSLLRHLTHLETLHMRHADLKDVEVLRELTHLRELSLRSTDVADLGPIRGLTRLEELDVSDTKVEDLSALRSLRSLRVLDISDSPVRDLEGLQSAQNLEILECGFSKLRDVSALSACRSLERVDLSCTEVADLSPLRGKPLQVLILLRTPVSRAEIDALRPTLPSGCVIAYE